MGWHPDGVRAVAGPGVIAQREMRPVRLWLYLMVEPTGLVDRWNVGEGKLRKIQWPKQLEERRAQLSKEGVSMLVTPGDQAHLNPRVSTSTSFI